MSISEETMLARQSDSFSTPLGWVLLTWEGKADPQLKQHSEAGAIRTLHCDGGWRITHYLEVSIVVSTAAMLNHII